MTRRTQVPEPLSTGFFRRAALPPSELVEWLQLFEIRQITLAGGATFQAARRVPRAWRLILYWWKLAHYRYAWEHVERIARSYAPRRPYRRES